MQALDVHFLIWTLSVVIEVVVANPIPPCMRNTLAALAHRFGLLFLASVLSWTGCRGTSPTSLIQLRCCRIHTRNCCIVQSVKLPGRQVNMGLIS